MQRSRISTPLMFIAVGCAAAAVHFAIALMLIRSGLLQPLQANVLAWLCAFAVSFTGHHRLTFRANLAPRTRAAMRFLLVSAGAFAVNEAAYAALLHWTRLPYDVALALVLMGVAAFTYLLGRHWAFLGDAAV
ncbi:hypothetical protein BH09PSE5_BH09PSE5_18520 [soil metagenome]